MADYTHHEAVGWIWSVADIIRDQGYHQSQYGDVILPFVVLRRLGQAAEDNREKALELAERLHSRDIEGEMFVEAMTHGLGQSFYNTAPLSFERLLDDPDNLAKNLEAFIDGFSPNVRDVFKAFELRERHIGRLRSKNLLYPVVARFSEIDLSPDRVSNLDMGYIFEELIRRFAELKNEEAGHHYTPREVIRLMVDLLFIYSDELLTQPGKIITMLDPACGTGGMLSIAEERLRELNADVDFWPFGQDFDDQSYAIALSEQLMTGRQELNVTLGNSLTNEDGYRGRLFDFVLANPPYGVSWKQYSKDIEQEHEQMGLEGRYGAGLPRKRDGQLLFVQHMISKMQPVTEDAPGTRIAIIMNASPLFNGDAGSGESEIRRWIIENDYLEAVVGLPTDLFYNTDIATYIWLLTNNKSPSRKGQVQLVDARGFYKPMDRSLGKKRVKLSEDHISAIVSLYGDEVVNEQSIWMANHELAYKKVPIRRPRRVRILQGADAISRLRSHPDWQDLAVRKRCEEPLKVRAAIETRIESLDTGELSPEYLSQLLEDIPEWRELLKRSKTAVIEAMMVDDPEGVELRSHDGSLTPDPSFEYSETVPANVDIDDYMETYVHPHEPAAFPLLDKIKTGYEIPFTERFYKYSALPPTDELDEQLLALETEIVEALARTTR